MKLLSPFSIGSRLLPCLNVGCAAVSLEAIGCRNNRMVYRWYVDLADGTEFSEADLEQPGSYPSDAAADQAAFGSLLAFLDACADGIRYIDAHPGSEPDAEDLFPHPVAEWARANQDEIGMLRLEIEEGGTFLLADDE